MIDITLQEGDGFGDDVGSGMLDSRPSSRRGSISAPSGRRRKTSQAWRPKVRAYFLTHSLSLSLSLQVVHSCGYDQEYIYSCYDVQYAAISQTGGPILVKEYCPTVGSPRHTCFSPTPLVRTSQSSRGSNVSTLDCSLVALDLESNTEVDDSAFCSPHVPMSTESTTPKEQFVVRT